MLWWFIISSILSGMLLRSCNFQIRKWKLCSHADVTVYSLYEHTKTLADKCTLCLISDNTLEYHYTHSNPCLVVFLPYMTTHSVRQASFKAVTLHTTSWYSTSYDSRTVGSKPLFTVVTSWIAGAAVVDTVKWCNVAREDVLVICSKQWTYGNQPYSQPTEI